jgi:hypothetical protein
VKSITNPYQLVLNQGFNGTVATQTFTIDTATTQVPTRFDNIYWIDRIETTFRRKVEIVALDNITDQEEQDEGQAYTNYNTPKKAALWVDGQGRKYLRVYPKPEADKSITLYGFVKIKPRFYTNVALTSTVPLTEDFEPMIGAWVKAMIYKVYKRDDAEFKFYDEIFEQGIQNYNRALPATQRTEVVYK